MCLSIFLFLSGIGTCPQILILTRGVKHWEKTFSTRGYAKIQIQRPFFDNKKDMKNYCVENPNKNTYPSASSTHRNFYFWVTLKSQILVAFQSSWSQLFLGKFWQFWADSTALTMVESMPKLGLKYLKPHNFWTMSPNAMCSVSLKRLPSMSIASKNFKKSNNLLHSQQLAKKRKEPFWLSWSFRG
jgi:hypothetical protein